MGSEKCEKLFTARQLEMITENAYLNLQEIKENTRCQKIELNSDQ